MPSCFRYVESDELTDVRARGALAAGINSCGGGKWVALREADAWKWAKKMVDPPLTGLVLELNVPDPVWTRAFAIATRQGWTGPSYDGIGPAMYLPSDDLHSIVVLREVPNESA